MRISYGNVLELLFWLKSPRPLVPNIPEWSVTATKVYDAFGLTEEQYWMEVKFTNKILQEKDHHDKTMV